MMFGIGTKKARVHADAFINLLGEDSSAWGLSHKGCLWHGGRYKSFTKPFRENVGTTIGIYFDGINGTLTYYKDGVCLGVAFQNLHKVKEPLYPMVCSTAAKTEMHLGVTKRDFVSLQDVCRGVILKNLTNAVDIEQLELPRTVRSFIYDGLEDYQNNLEVYHNNARR